MRLCQILHQRKGAEARVTASRLIVALEGEIIDAGKRTYDHAGLPHRDIRNIGPPDVGGWAQAAR